MNNSILKRRIAIKWVSCLILLFANLLIFISCKSKVPEEVEMAYSEIPEIIDFNLHVRPILSDRCFHCHGPDEKGRKGNLRLDVEHDLFAKIKGKETYAVVAGKPSKSKLVHRILSYDPKEVMPPIDSKLDLSFKEKAMLVKWVEQGAIWKGHWAFIAPEKIGIPCVKNKAWAINDIDYFVLEKLESLGLSPSAQASREVLIRRLSFDLLGLPPTPEEVKVFIEDNTPDAYEKLVDRILSSLRYGERWAWEWLDVARYADTNGYQGDRTRDMWPWRDWVITAFNDNMPYSEFTIKQLAGDLLPNASRNDILATAFNRNHPYNTEGGTIPEETRVVNVFDRVETTGTAWMGLTLECARCHDHKFDAITQKEYYQLYDYFNQTSEEGRGRSGKVEPVLSLGEPKQVKELDQLRAYLEGLFNEVEEVELKQFPRKPEQAIYESEKFKKLETKDDWVLKKPAKYRSSSEFERLAKYFREERNYGLLLQKTAEGKRKFGDLGSEMIQVMVMDTIENRRKTHVLNRGGYNDPRLNEPVSMNVPAVLPQLPEDIKNNRLALAKWLVSEEQPLTARVTVNRYWQAFFGHGIVKTIDDFGVQGEPPSHPELLDWLARDFQDSNWNLKALFKKIVMTATYRQSSKLTEELLQKDPENRLLARATRMRLPSWMLRDQALFVSGLMVDSIGGRPVKSYQPSGIWEEASFGKIKYQQDHGDALYRRTLYSFWRRIVGPTMLFDNSTRHKSAVKTQRTNTPLHALNTLNDVTYMEASRVLAANVLTLESTMKNRLEYLFQRIVSRKPTAKELEILQNRLVQLKKEYSEAKEDAKKIITAGEFLTNKALNTSEFAAYSVVSSMILNLDETITRQ